MAVHAPVEQFAAGGVVGSRPVMVGENVEGCVLPRAVADKLEEQVRETGKFPVLTINARGDLIGDLSSLPAETVEKLQSPEARERMKAMYRKEFGSGRRETVQRVRRQPASAHPTLERVGLASAQRDFRHLCPPGMSGKEFRKLRRKFLHKQTKVVLKEMKHASN